MRKPAMSREPADPFRRDFRKASCKLITDAAHYRHNLSTLFRDMVEVFFIAGRNGHEPRDAAWQTREARYMELVAVYGREIFDAFATLLAELHKEARDRHGDLLGEIYQELQANQKGLGQFFTPYQISSLMAQLSFPESHLLEHIDRHGYLTACEPTCGSGGMIVAIAETIRNLGHEPLQVLRVMAQDIDPVCWQMTYISCWLYRIPAKIILGDTIANEERAVVFSPSWFEAAARALPGFEPPELQVAAE